MLSGHDQMWVYYWWVWPRKHCPIAETVLNSVEGNHRRRKRWHCPVTRLLMRANRWLLLYQCLLGNYVRKFVEEPCQRWKTAMPKSARQKRRLASCWKGCMIELAACWSSRNLGSLENNAVQRLVKRRWVSEQRQPIAQRRVIVMEEHSIALATEEESTGIVYLPKQ